jgi:hypothetical protein
MRAIVLLAVVEAAVMGPLIFAWRTCRGKIGPLIRWMMDPEEDTK